MYVECVIISDKRTARQKREVMYSLLFVDTLVPDHNKQYKKAFLREVIVSLEVALQRS